MSNKAQMKLHPAMRKFQRMMDRQARLKRYEKMHKISKWNIVRGDKVEMLEGPDKGKQGIVKTVIRRVNRVIVEGLQMRKRMFKPTAERPGYITMMESPTHVTNVMLVDPATGLKTKIARKVLDGEKVRVAKRSGAIIPKPDILAQEGKRNTHVNKLTDTTPENVFEVTYKPLDFSILGKLDMSWGRERSQKSLRPLGLAKPEEVKMPARRRGLYNIKGEVLRGKKHPSNWLGAMSYIARMKKLDVNPITKQKPYRDPPMITKRQIKKTTASNAQIPERKRFTLPSEKKRTR